MKTLLAFCLLLLCTQVDAQQRMTLIVTDEGQTDICVGQPKQQYYDSQTLVFVIRNAECALSDRIFADNFEVPLAAPSEESDDWRVDVYATDGTLVYMNQDDCDHYFRTIAPDVFETTLNCH